MAQGFLPMTMDEARRRGWDEVDFVYVSGDAYVDHPSFGAAIITRVLEANGYRVGVIAQPDWTDPQSIAVCGEPRLGCLVSAGNMDSMVNHYTSSKKPRRNDAYSPEAGRGFAPITPPPCTGAFRRVYKKTIILGGMKPACRTPYILVRQAEAFYSS
ncbi:MAG: hypothetical protein ACLT98_16130 [Eggerthellaceae bacterium]